MDAARKPERFKPVRAGIINLWDYVNEIFLFADGRLVLRGHNGAGKTKALEVLVPFVLDGRMDPRRLDPFSGDTRTMKENLLYRGNEAAYGYVWMEFARGRGRGEPVERVTIGVGMHARKHKEDVTPWFFVTDGSLGRDFHLVVDGRPRTRSELTAALGEERVKEKARDYRDMVDARLFGLGERYDQMLGLVLTLRKPQLSKDLDPDSLSKVLSEGLRPLDDELLAQVAKSFEDLELAQGELQRLGNADATLQSFLTLYRGHVRAVARHRVDQARNALHAVERGRADLTTAQSALEAAKGQEATATAELARTRRELIEARAEKEGLLESPAYKALSELKTLEDYLATAQRTMDDAASDIDGLRLDLQELDHSVASVAAELGEAQRAREVTAIRVRVAAHAATMEWEESDGARDADAVATALKARIGARRADVMAVEARISRVTDAEARAAAADEARQAAETKRNDAERQLAAAEAAVAAKRQEWVASVRGWAAARPPGTLGDGDLDHVLALVDSLGAPEATTPRDVLSARLAPRIDHVVREQTDVKRRHDEALDRDRELEARCAEILAERDDAPAPIHTRPASRVGRAGAPLWRLVRFRDDVPDAAATGIEAALEASGILDAWLAPSNEPGDEVLDAFLLGGSATTEAGTLADALEPEEHPEIGSERILAVLRTIAFPLDAASSAAFVAGDGTYRLGPLGGRYRTDRVRYIGATARHAHRQRRVADLKRERDELAATRRGLTDELARLTDQRKAYVAALADLPPTAAIAEALRVVHTCQGVMRGAAQAERAAVEALAGWKREVNDRREALRREASARSLPLDAGALRQVSGSLREIERSGSELVAAIRRLAWAETQASEWKRQRAKRGAELPTREQQLAKLTTTRDRLRVELATVRSSLGADAATLEAQLAGVVQRIRGLDEEEIIQDEAARSALETRTTTQSTVAHASEAVDGAERACRTATSALGPLVDAELALVLDLGVAVGRAPTADTRSAELDALITRLDATTRGISGSEERRKTALSQVTTNIQQLSAQLAPHFRAEFVLDDDIVRVTIADDEGKNSVAAFAQKLSERKRQQEALLTVREREVFEDALLSSLCRQLHVRTTAARNLVRQMDRAMRERRMSSGKSVGVSWLLKDDLSAEQRRVVKSLDFDPANLPPEDLDALRVHFSREVKAARETHPNRSYRDILSSVLDYRGWRRFVLHLADADGHEELLTKSRHSKLSGGEKASSLHIPLFAAAHAQFSSAHESCPRLIALDEAFAGIDSRGRPELMSLSVEFDLDLFMTGYDLWVTFPSVPMASHYDLVHVPSEHTVSALLLLWDGGQLIEGERAETLIHIAAGA